MIKNYLKIAFRNLSRYKFNSFINLFGLTIGFTCCLLILVFITNELSFDKYNRNADRIYRVTRKFTSPEGKQWLNLGTVAPPFGPLLQNDFPDIEKITRLLPIGTTPLRYEEKIFNEEKAFYADENLFSVFNVSVIKGDPRRALNDPFCVMLSEGIAKKYFGNEDPVNKVIRQNNTTNYKVTGIYKAFPSNSHIHPEILFSFNTLRDSTVYGENNLKTNWGNNSFFTYLLLPANYPADKIAAEFPSFIDKHMPVESGQGIKASGTTSLSLQKLTDIHLRSHMDYEAEENGDINRVYIFSAIALFILLIACINYMNLSTARSVLRAKEIGIRKVVGAERKEIIFQFLSESIMVTSIALLFSLVFAWLAIPWLNDISGQQLSLALISNWKMILLLVAIPFIVGIISGLYPAFFMSSFQPVKVLKGLMRVQAGNISFRQVLVVTQFSISIILIIATAVVFQQLNYMQRKSLGFDREHIVTLPYDGALTPQYEAFRNELLGNPAIKDAARSSRIPTGRLLDAQGAAIPVGDTVAPIKADIKMVATDYDFIPTYGIKMAAGRNFSREYKADTTSFIINEATLSVLGIKTVSDVVGKPFVYAGIKGRIIGVVQDFHFESMHEHIIPLVLLLPPPTQGFYNRLSVKIAGKDIPGGLTQLEKTWKHFLPEAPFAYTFLDEYFDILYQAENRQGTLFTTFSCLAILIACLGLFGLSAFTITQRVKEIGIRKVLGASIGNIVRMISKDFLKLVLVAAVIAFPVAWYAMHKWLEDFAYRVGISWWIFGAAAIIAFLIALLTISFQAIKAAIANPVKSLRTE
ncbi:MAG: FtsX-like permease family protein [Ferruginibacter sp.]|nr:FtsX-like permease family protein [Ferruginibacter sp.]